MRGFLKTSVPAVLIIAIIASAYLLLSGGDEREVKNIVITYNRLLQEAHSEGKSELLRKITSERQFVNVDSYITYLFKNRKLFLGEAKDIIFENVTIDDDTAVVVTRETWSYTYINPYTRQPVSENFIETYGTTYHLKKDRGRWIVDALDSKKIE
jgi:hypothetical protein